MNIRETQVNLISEGTRIEGKLILDHVSRIHGVVIGEVLAKDGSQVVLGETGMIEGNIHGDFITIDGFVRGDITAKNDVIVSRTGRVIGDIKAKSMKLEFGAYFEGQCTTQGTASAATEDLSQKTV